MFIAANDFIHKRELYMGYKSYFRLVDLLFIEI